MAITAGNWQLVDANCVGFQPIGDRDTTQRHPLGTVVRARDVGTTNYGEGEFVYVLGIADGAAKKWAIYNLDNGITTLLVADGIGPVGVMMSALTASYYGWLQISGKAVGLVKTSFTDNGIVWCTSTAGSIDDASVVGDMVELAKGASAGSSLQAEFEISRPFVTDRHGNK